MPVAEPEFSYLTLARTRTQVLGFSSADALATKLRVPVAEPEFLSMTLARTQTQVPGFSSADALTTTLRVPVAEHDIYIYIYIIYIKVLGSNPSECHIFNLFRCVLSFSATLAKRWKVQFRLGLAINSTTLILITAY